MAETMTLESWSNTLVPKRSMEEFEFDSEQECYPEAALHRIELLMGMNCSFSVSFTSETSRIRGRLVNHVLSQASGYSDLTSKEGES